jgi:hypothetical protein
MFVRETMPGVFSEIRDGDRIIIGEITWATDILSTWSHDQLLAARIYPITPFVPPPGHRTTGPARYERANNGQIVQTYDTVPA